MNLFHFGTCCGILKVFHCRDTQSTYIEVGESMDITREEFMKKYRISPGQFADSQLSWDELREIAEDYERL